MRTIDDIAASIKARDFIACPHCGKATDMTDGERAQGHVTYWGDDAAQPIACWSCDADFYLKEYVTRHWVAGRTPEEAEEP